MQVSHSLSRPGSWPMSHVCHGAQRLSQLAGCWAVTRIAPAGTRKLAPGCTRADSARTGQRHCRHKQVPRARHAGHRQRAYCPPAHSHLLVLLQDLLVLRAARVVLLHAVDVPQDRVKHLDRVGVPVRMCVWGARGVRQAVLVLCIPITGPQALGAVIDAVAGALSLASAVVSMGQITVTGQSV